MEKSFMWLKSSFLLSFSLLCFGFLGAQEFAPLGAKWTYFYQQCAWQGCEDFLATIEVIDKKYGSKDTSELEIFLGERAFMSRLIRSGDTVFLEDDDYRGDSYPVYIFSPPPMNYKMHRHGEIQVVDTVMTSYNGVLLTDYICSVTRHYSELRLIINEVIGVVAGQSFDPGDTSLTRSMHTHLWEWRSIYSGVLDWLSYFTLLCYTDPNIGHIDFDDTNCELVTSVSGEERSSEICELTPSVTSSGSDVWLDCQENTGLSSYRLVNMNGHIVDDGLIQEGKIRIESDSKGLHVMQFVIGGVIHSKKIVIH